MLPPNANPTKPGGAGGNAVHFDNHGRPAETPRSNTGPATSPLDALIDEYPNARANRPRAAVSIRYALQCIGNGKWAEPVAEVRKLLEAGDRSAYNREKKKLPAYTFAGRFSPTRAKKNLVSHSSCVVLDLDYLEALDATRQLVQADPAVLFCFTSPSGEGLKVGLRTPTCADAWAHWLAWKTAAEHAKAAWKARVDTSGQDASRLCFVSHDSQLYTNENAVCIVVSGDTEETQDTQDTEAMEAALVGDSCVSPQSLRRAHERIELNDTQLELLSNAIRSTAPRKTGKRNRAIFDFARYFRALLPHATPRHALELGLLNEWHQEAVKVGSASGFAETVADFSYAWKRVRHPHGAALATALQRARELPSPQALDAARQVGLDSPFALLLAALCFELGGNGRQFPLAVRVASNALGCTPRIAHKWLDALDVAEVIRCVKRGDQFPGGKASEYVWVGGSR